MFILNFSKYRVLVKLVKLVILVKLSVFDSHARATVARSMHVQIYGSPEGPYEYCFQLFESRLIICLNRD